MKKLKSTTNFKHKYNSYKQNFRKFPQNPNNYNNNLLKSKLKIKETNLNYKPFPNKILKDKDSSLLTSSL